ncbi:hypothetical protein, partial [Klebsiella pneumoniae]|uniref:hypothetical protein n=1 Tax=Klebsiella pneumoniae TaxID=573 RepID=UPI003F523A1C
MIMRVVIMVFMLVVVGMIMVMVVMIMVMVLMLVVMAMVMIFFCTFIINGILNPLQIKAPNAKNVIQVNFS